MRRVLFVSHVLANGGAERFVSNALQFLDRKRFDLHLALFRREIVYPLSDDIAVHVLEKHTRFDIPKAIWRMARAIDRIQPHIVVTPFTGISLFASEALRLARHKPRWVARIANNPAIQDKGLYGRWAARALRRADMYVANSQGLAACFRSVYGIPDEHVVCIYNFVDFASIDRVAREEPAVPIEHRPTLVAVGRMHAQKRYDVLLEAFARLRKDIDAHLIILGDGPLRAELHRLVDDLGLASAVRMPGFVDNP